MNKTATRILLLAISALTLAGCANSKPEDPAVRRHRFVQQHHELSHERKANILKGSIQNGMSIDEVRASWGDPKTTQRPGQSGSDETWVYPNGYSIDFTQGKMLRLRAPDGTTYEN